MAARYSIGIDLGTTNSALAFAPLEGEEAGTSLFEIPQYESAGSVVTAATLPSFLYLSPEAESTGRWQVGRLARKQAADTPGRVVHSAKSWLCHHVADRSAPFLPWRSDEIPVNQRISPIRASSLILAHLREAWDQAHPEAPFAEQRLTITVPASFDAVAQGLNLEAAREAGCGEPVQLLEEPQAAFYRWLERGESAEGHVLVVDIGGGTSDFSLFEIRPDHPLPKVKRIAVSEHLLLGGDNLDLALAHILEPRLTEEGLAPAQWNQLVARCRDVKERCLGGDPAPTFKVSIPGRGSGLFASALSAELTREEIEMIVLEGFYPETGREERPAEAEAGLREWALPYTADSAVTRYLADFLRDRPRVDAVLFNGGSLQPERLRQRLREQIGRWQGGEPPRELVNEERDLAVAHGAARFGRLVHRRTERIEAGAARALYLEVHQSTGTKQLICILPRGAPEEERFVVEPEGLQLRLNRRARFQVYHSPRGREEAGEMIDLQDQVRLPALHTTAELEGKAPAGVTDRLPVRLESRINALGLLQVECVSAHPRVKQVWPLEFDLRTSEAEVAPVEIGVDPARLERACAAIARAFQAKPDPRRKLTANQVLKELAEILALPKGEWNGPLLRALWETLAMQAECRRVSVDHEETWISLAGYFLRPGFGAEADADRLERLWSLLEPGLVFPGKRNRLQLWLLWRRVTGGLSGERQERLLHPEIETMEKAKSLPAEWVRMAGAFERLPVAVKERLISDFLRRVGEPGHHPPYFVALGLLLNRMPLAGNAEEVVPPERVLAVFEALRGLDWEEPENLEVLNLFLRAARVVDDPSLDVPKGVRQTIASRLERAGVKPGRTERIRRHHPLDAADRSGLFGEALPPGLVIREG